jgi:CRP-like cAMP-binding protein
MMIRLGNLLVLRKERNINYQKDPCSSCSLILSGNVSKMIYLSNGGTIKIGTGKRGNWIGMTELIQNSPYLYDSRTIKETVILQFTRNNFQQLMAEQEFNKCIIQQLTREIILLHRSMEYNTPRARIIQLIRERVVVGLDGTALLTMTQDSMAEETGTTRETVNRCLKNLERSGIVRTGRGCIEVIDLEVLDMTD